MAETHGTSESELQAIKSRRSLFRKGAGLLAFAGASQLSGMWAKGATSTTATPTETEGPFWVDLQLNRTNVRSNTAAATSNPGVTVTGLPLHLTIGLSKISNNVITPTSGAYVDIWQCNAQGSYSDESNTTNINESYTVGQNFLRGYQVTNSHGLVNFISNYPAYYNGRCPHIHVRVRQYSGSTVTTNFTTQLFFPDTITTEVYAKNSAYATTTTRIYNTQDMVYTQVTASAGSTTSNPDGAHTTVKIAEDGTYAVASYNIVLA